MIDMKWTAVSAARRSFAQCYAWTLGRGSQLSKIGSQFRVLAAAVAALFLVCGSAANADVFMPSGTPLKNFGFAAGGRANSYTDYQNYFNVTREMFGAGGLLRTGLGWDPTQATKPNFEVWSRDVLSQAMTRDLIVIPSIRTINLGTGELRIPTDAQWIYGLREIVKMYGPNGTYQKTHPGFRGLTDFEIWNEPESKGDANGNMTPAIMARLLKLASTTMRAQARLQGFQINIMGPGILDIQTDFLKKMKAADALVFSYIDTMVLHIYTRNGVNQCSAPDKRCVKTLESFRSYLNSAGGIQLHMGVTEAGIAGDKGTCLGPQVRTEEQQAQWSADNFNWMRARPQLKMDFWITTFPLDMQNRYSYACGSNNYDPDYWMSKLGVKRADGTLKPWGVKWKQLVAQWR